MIVLTHSWMPYDAERPHVAWAVIDSIAEVFMHAGIDVLVWRDTSQNVVKDDDTLIVSVTGTNHKQAVMDAAARVKRLAAIFEDTNWDTSWHPGRSYVAITPYASLANMSGVDMHRTITTLGPRLDIDVPTAHVWMPTASIANATEWGQRLRHAFDNITDDDATTDAVYVGSLKTDRVHGFAMAVRYGTTFYGNFTRDDAARALTENGYTVDDMLDACVFGGRTRSPYEVAAISSRFKHILHMPDESFIRLDCDAVRYLELLLAKNDSNDIVLVPPRSGDDDTSDELNTLAHQALTRRVDHPDEWLMTSDQLTKWAHQTITCINECNETHND